MNHKPACNDRSDLPGDVGARRLHDKYIAGVFFHSQFLYYPGRHRERGDTCGAYHRIDFLVQEQIQDFGKENAPYGIQDKCNQADSHNKEGIYADKSICFHAERNRNPQKQGNQIGQGILGGFRQGAKDAAFTDKVAEHKKTYQSYRRRGDKSYNKGNGDWENDAHGLGNLGRFVFHVDAPLFPGGYQFDGEGLYNRD